MQNNFFPICKADMQKRGWDYCDIILITGDAYVDHHSFGAAVIGRVLEKYGFRVGIIAEPDINNLEDFKKLGRPNLFFGITSGNIDSMVANYTANKKPRRGNEYSSKTYSRPDRALIIYSNKVREAFKNAAIVLGGLEASMRRLAHYDYWSDKVRRSVLLDTKADILIYGMGERQIIEIAERMKKGDDIKNINDIRGTVVVRNDYSFLKEYVLIPSFEEVSSDKDKFNAAYKLFYDELSPKNSKAIVQQHSNRFVIQFPSVLPLTEAEIDEIYDLPYARAVHPAHKGATGFNVVQNSITAHRGCPGECSFCGIGLHQGRIIQSRSKKSIVEESKKIASQKNFDGTITDVGGATANLYGAMCKLWEKGIVCKDKSCLYPTKCENLKLNYDELLKLYELVKKNAKHVFIRSGIRYDLLVEDDANQYLEELCKHYIGGQMKVAPEHVSTNVLRLMHKPDISVYKKFVKKFKEITKKLNKNLFLVNYFISAHPGATIDDAKKLSLYCKNTKIFPEQIQDYLALPMTVSACMYYTGKHPFTNEKVYVPKGERERKIQRMLTHGKY